MTLKIGVAASSTFSKPETAKRFVSVLPFSTTLFLGGYWGLMADVADSAWERGLNVVFILPYGAEDVPNRRGFIPVKTEMEPRARSAIICSSSDVLVSLGGESGTMIEILMAYGMGKPVVVLKGTGMSTDRLAEGLGEKLDYRNSSIVKYVESPEVAGLEAIRLASGLTQRPLKSI